MWQALLHSRVPVDIPSNDGGVFGCHLQCNNPLTKEAKLTAAKRIVPEWTEYDNEVKQLWDQIYKSSSSAKDSEDSRDSNTGEVTPVAE